MTCTHLPPVRVILVEDLQDFAAVEPKSSLLAGDQIIVSGVVIEVAFHERLMVRKHTRFRSVLTRDAFIYLGLFGTKFWILIGQRI